jgi:hypothetical protein
MNESRSSPPGQERRPDVETTEAANEVLWRDDTEFTRPTADVVQLPHGLVAVVVRDARARSLRRRQAHRAQVAR